MSDVLVPSWIQKRKDIEELERINAETAVLKDKAAAQKISSDSPKLWKNLLKELDLTARGLIQLDIRAYLSELAQDSLEERYRLDVAKNNSLIADVGYVDIVYRPNSRSIGIYPNWQKMISLSFCLQGDFVSIMADDGFTPMDVEGCARFIGEIVADRF